MAQRGRRFNAILALRAFVCAAVIVCCLLLTACGYNVIYSIDGYGAFLSGYEKYSVDYGLAALQIDGFTLVSNRVFDYGTAFGADVAYVTSGESAYVLKGDGTLVQAQFGTEGTFTEGKFVYCKNGKYGLTNVFGTVLLDARYDFIKCCGSAVLAARGNEFTLYSADFDSEYAVMCGITHCADADLLSGEYTLANSKICDLTFSPMYADGKLYADLPSEGKVAVIGESGYFGYFDLTDKTFIGGSYTAARPFKEGTAVVRIDGRNAVIDKYGNELYSSAEDNFGELYGGYRVFEHYSLYGIMDKDFNVVTAPRFRNIKYNRAFGGKFIICENSRCKIYSPLTGEFSREYEDIEFDGGLFFCKTGDGVTVLTEDLAVVTECEYAEYSCGVLTVKRDGKFAYYVRNFD